ncbi:MAG: TetR/AcrR family transcriptional regulator [Gammaproteobacteria bacterium]|nr:TetR/AcrR family transcriptional regulator [Gammaproteobacteria bacterium]
MNRTAATRPPRQDNRRQTILDASAALFSRRGYHATSLRDIAAAAGMLPGSVYYHFASKEELLLAVYAAGVERIAARVDAAVEKKRTPRARLEAACVAHLETLLERSDYAQVVVRVLPRDADALGNRLARLRNDYERRFRRLVNALETPRNRDRKLLRLALLGALNGAQIWYRPNGDPPKKIARRFLDLMVPAEEKAG